jgi:hypothetical protein
MIQLNVYSTLVITLIIQVLTGIIDSIIIFIKISPKLYIIKQLLALELLVQFIEGFFYLYWFYNFKNIKNVTPTRYFDWSITTPSMLITLIFYLIFVQYKENNLSESLEFFDLFYKNVDTIIPVLLLNWAMLLFGYLAEIKVIPVLLGVLSGFIPFFIYYYIIYTKYVVLSNEGIYIFLYFFFFWSFYGLSALLPYNTKNICYNILDLFSKNFFAIFLAYVIITNNY